MSTRCNVIVKDEHATVYVYRHSDGYPEVAGEDLIEFVKGYAPETGPIDSRMRCDAMQSAGWLILRGHVEYLNAKPFTGKPDLTDKFYGWKVGAYEPTDKLHADVEYVYVIDLVRKTLVTREPKTGFWDKPTLANTKVLATHEFGGGK